jgi:hypothetical protein
VSALLRRRSDKGGLGVSPSRNGDARGFSSRLELVFIEYNGELQINSSLLSVVLRD